MSIPFLILRRVRISSYQKIALSAVFSLVIVTMIFAIIRAVITTVGVKRQIDPIWFFMWTTIELNIAIIVACIAPYRSLFIRGRNHEQEPRWPPNVKARARELWSSYCSNPWSSRRQREDENWSAMELPYLAPWVDNAHGAQQDVGPERKVPDYGATHICTREDPSMTADMPYLAPWNERQNEANEHARESRDILLSLPPPAHVTERLQP